jgi:hypothetical protein
MMDPITVSLILSLIPVVQKLVVGGIEIWMREDMTTEEIITALEKSKDALTPMVPKA